MKLDWKTIGSLLMVINGVTMLITSALTDRQTELLVEEKVDEALKKKENEKKEES